MREFVSVCRSVHFPKYIKSGVFDNELLLKFDNIKGTENYGMSVASRLIAGSDEEIHKYGSDAAAAKNARFERDKGRRPNFPDEEVHYLGFYEIQYSNLISVLVDHYVLHCYWDPTAEERAHFQAELTRKRKTSATRFELRQDRQFAVNKIFKRLRGPTRFLSDVDVAVREILEEIKLPVVNPDGSVQA